MFLASVEPVCIAHLVPLRAVVIGGGLAGLTTVHRLTRRLTSGSSRAWKPWLSDVQRRCERW